jgi:hypothetical protein
MFRPCLASNWQLATSPGKSDAWKCWACETLCGRDHGVLKGQAVRAGRFLNDRWYSYTRKEAKLVVSILVSASYRSSANPARSCNDLVPRGSKRSTRDRWIDARTITTCNKMSKKVYDHNTVFSLVVTVCKQSLQASVTTLRPRKPRIRCWSPVSMSPPQSYLVSPTLPDITLPSPSPLTSPPMTP